MIAAGVPGVFMRIADMDPPYTEPIYTAASVIRPVVGDMLNVIGIKSATPIVDVRPGRAPIIIPIITPIIEKKRFVGDNAIIMDCKSKDIVNS